jgi:alpha-1,2-mannosyltransferase
MTRPDRGKRPFDGALPAVAIVVFAGFVGLTIAISGDTLGFDFLAYHAAAARVLDGRQLYDMSFEEVGGFGLFFYPPVFLPLILPFGLLEPAVATWAWIGLSLLSFGVGVAVMPVAASTRWLIVLLAAVSWPFLFAVKLGQVGPLLFLALAVGWRWMDRPIVLGGALAAATAIKIQPALVLGWAVLTGRWRAVLYAAVFLVMLAIAAAIFTDASAWSNFAALLLQLADPMTNERNMSPGAVAFQLGVPLGVAGVVQLVNLAVVLVLVGVAAFRAEPNASYLVAVVASQLVSPILWEHYAMLLLLPVAYLLSIGWRWAVVIPLATAVALVTLTPPIVYPIAFYVTLIATLVAGWRPARASRAASPSFA